jgi:hypothetical protein
VDLDRVTIDHAGAAAADDLVGGPDEEPPLKAIVKATLGVPAAGQIQSTRPATITKGEGSLS